MSNPISHQGKDWKKHQHFAKLVEQVVKNSTNPTYTRSRLWVAKITREYLGGV